MNCGTRDDNMLPGLPASVSRGDSQAHSEAKLDERAAVDRVANERRRRCLEAGVGAGLTSAVQEACSGVKKTSA